MIRSVSVALAILLLSACASRGPVAISCNGWDGYVQSLPPSQLVKDIQSDTVLEASVAPRISTVDQSSEPFSAGPMFSKGVFAAEENRPPVGPTLLLSGGGQWGAFGAGYIDQLADQDPSKYAPIKDIAIVTGVSTGGLQSLFVATEDYDGLVSSYAPDNEDEIVDRGSFLSVALSGSLAGLGPLRAKIERSLCTDGDPAKGCPMIDALNQQRRLAIIGFVHAASGEFQYVIANDIASNTDSENTPTAIARRREAQQCLTGAALASAAMPVFFQQVQVNGETYYDGGARQSVFEPAVVEAISDMQMNELRTLRGVSEDTADIELPPVYVIRNGPTTLAQDQSGAVNRKADALTAGQQAYSIIVNQVEIQSIAGLRLAHPTGEIFLATADGYDREHDGVNGETQASAREVCRKQSEEIMFDPQFMACLTRFGRAKAERDGERKWIGLSELETP